MHTLPPDFEQQLRSFLQLAGNKAYASASLPEFTQWVRTAVPVIFPALISQIPDDPQEVKLFLGMAAGNLYADFPLPSRELQPTGKAKQGRNDPCGCGSGQKYKNCCGSMAMPPLFGQLNLLRFVLDAYPKNKLAGVAASKASIDAVADTAHQWLQEGDTARAVALLEPFFAGDGPLNARLGPMFDLLMNAWLSLGKHGKREKLLDAISLRGDRLLRSDALQRRTTMLADRGEHAAAWRCFKQASELNPNDPALSFLEVTTLVSEGRTTEAQGRAQWWAAFLAKQRDPSLAGLVEHLRSMAHDPHGGIMAVALQANADWQRLNDLFQDAPQPTLRHKFAVYEQASEDNEVPFAADAFVPDAALAKLESRWRKCYRQVKPGLTSVQHGDPSVWDNAPDWLDLLQKNPALWFSFEVLDDLVMAVDTIELAGVQERLLVPMAERAAEQLRLTLESAKKQPVQCHWAVLQHRPALRPVAHLAFICNDDGHQDKRKALRFVELARWMVFELNPNDNHGLRSDLSSALMHLERWDDAVALNTRYPDDTLPTLRLNALLARFILGQPDGLAQDLLRAAKDYPNAIKALVAITPKPVKPDDEYGISIGGKYEAWLYVQEMRALWDQHHALEWARAVLDAKGRKVIAVPTGQQSLL